MRKIAGLSQLSRNYRFKESNQKTIYGNIQLDINWLLLWGSYNNIDESGWFIMKSLIENLFYKECSICGDEISYKHLDFLCLECRFYIDTEDKQCLKLKR